MSIEITLRLVDEKSLAFLLSDEGAEIYRVRLRDNGDGTYGLQGLADVGYSEATGVGVVSDPGDDWGGKRP